MLWPIEMAFPVLKAFQQVTATAPDELTLWAHLLRFPPLPELPDFLRGGSFVSVEAAHLGTAEEVAQLLAPFRAIPAMILDSVTELPVDQLGTICAEPVDPMPTTEWSSLLTDLSDEALTALLAEVGHQAACPLMVVQLRHLGGALARGHAAEGPEAEEG